MKGQLSRVQDLNQQQVENQLASLGISLALLEHDELRIRQAMGRHDELLDLLRPVLQDIGRVASSIRRAQAALRERWEDGQSKKWEP